MTSDLKLISGFSFRQLGAGVPKPPPAAADRG
jgi:hypothetical protein